MKQPPKQGTTTKWIIKNVNGKNTRYLYITKRQENKKTIVKGYRYRGGKIETYIKESEIPKGVKYHVNYKKGQITTDPNKIEALTKQVKAKPTKKKTRTGKPKTKPKQKPTSIIIKRAGRVPTPPAARSLNYYMPHKTFYERQHDLTEINTKAKETMLLQTILGNTTRKKSDIQRVIDNFDKIKLKFSYLVEIYGTDESGRTQQIGWFTTAGKRPIEVAKIVEEIGLNPGLKTITIGTGQEADIRTQTVKLQLERHGIHANQQRINTGRYQITNVRTVIKFYNNPTEQK